MNELFEKLKDKIKSTDIGKLTDIQEELVKAKNNNELTDDEFHRLKEAIANRLAGFNL